MSDEKFTEEQIKHLQHVVREGQGCAPHILMDSGGIPDNVEREWFDWFLDISRKIRAENTKETGK